jgi:ATP-dependent Lon protease
MPKNKGDPKSPKKKKKSNIHESDDDSSSDYDPQKDEYDEMSTLEMQKFIQKLFPSNSGQERLKQLEKLDKLMDKTKKNKNNGKKSNKKKSKNEEKKEDEEEDSDEQTDEEENYENEDSDDDEYEYDEDDYDEDELEDLMKNNMKFNIVFSVPGRGVGYDEYGYIDDEDEEKEDEEDEEKEDEEDEEDEKDEDEKEDEEDEEEKESPKPKKKSKIKDKLAKDATEEDWNKLFMEQEQEMKDNGTYYSTKYKQDDKVFLKLKGWDDFKQGKIKRVHKKSSRMRPRYDVILNKTYKGKKLHKSILSKNIKSYNKHINNQKNKTISKEQEESALLNELKQLLNAKKEGNDVLQKKFDELANVKAKKDEKIKKKKDALLKRKNFRTLRKLLQEKNVMNDFKYFQKLDLDIQTKILIKLKDINAYSNVEKPYKISLIESDIPVEFKEYAMKKISVLEYMDPSSGEYYKNKQWVDTFMRIPFNKHKNLPISMADGPEKCQEFIENAKNILDKAVYGLEDAKLQILQMIGQWISNPDAIGTAIAVKGPPGTGKTSLIKEGVSKILNRPFAFLALGGATDSSFLEGHSYTYEGSHWGKIVDILIKCKCMNPVFYFDELDKISSTPKGDEIVGILTHLTDTTQNDKFHDKYFANIDFDLRKSMFIFSYNDESKINPILKDRMYRIKTEGYKTSDKYIIARDYLIPKIEQNVNFDKDQIIFPEETINYICNSLTDKEKGVRNLKRCLEIIYTKLNLYRLMKKGSVLFNKKEIITVEFPFTVTQEIINKLIKKTSESNTPFGMYL